MKHEDFDIPEVFRRAMEEAGWRTERDDDGGKRPPRRNVTPSSRPRGINRTLVIIFLVLLFVFSLGSIASFYTDFLWFGTLGYQDMFSRRLVVRAITFVVAFTVAAAVLLGNWLLARRRTPPASGDAAATQAAGIGRAVILGAGLFLAFILAMTAAGQWENILLYLNAHPFGLDDPIFNRDVGFYIFTLPVYSFIRGWLIALLGLALIGLLPIYALPNMDVIQRDRRFPFSTPGLRRHAAVLGGLLLLVWATGYVLDIYNLMYSDRGVAYGASYTDMRAVIWALRLQLVFMVLTALALFANAFRPMPALPLVGAGLWLAVTIIAGGAVPGILQRYVVEPNELTLETPYIEHNIALTRRAFNLDTIEVREFGEVDDLQPADLLENEDILRNVRLWDWRPLQQTYRQLQGLRPYYEFNDVDIDRYMIDGQQRQVMIGTRELDKSKLPAPSWVNRNLEFTHGYGIVMNPVNEVTRDGQPQFFIQDFPPQSRIEIEVTRPEIYYGELTSDTVFVSSGRQEFSYPSGDENVYTNYQGSGGVVLDSFLKRLAFAMRLSDPNVLLNDDITNTTRAQFRRQIQDRVRALAPFLILDADPYLVVNDEGRLIWLQDAYTASDHFPYSTPIRFVEASSATVGSGGNVGMVASHTVNYIRNSVKIAIDAYNGSVDFYMSDPDDPIIRSYADAFPGVFQPMANMPADLAAHIRYPEDLYNIQAQQYVTYHMSDVRVFYNKEDLWHVPTEVSNNQEQVMEPYYVTLALPGSDDPEYLLILPFSPATRNNMIGWMAARNDPDHYGQLIVYELPKQELIFGPIQVEGRIDQEPAISEQFSLWDQRGSNVIRGNLLVLPINTSFLYIEPVYLLSETSALPELKRIVTASNTAVAMAETLGSSLRALAAGSVTPPAVTSEEATSPPATASPIEIPDTLAGLVEAANAHLRAAEDAQRAGDWAAYGRELDALRAILAVLAQATGEEQ